MKQNKPVIGLLGGVASGKSTVAVEFAKMGCAVIDADELAHQALTTLAIRQPLMDLLGPTVIDESGFPDRKIIGGIVFADRQKLAGLTALIHPIVLQETDRLIQQYTCNPRFKGIVLDMPLLLEVGWDKICDRIIFVDCDEKTRLARALTNRRMAETEFKIRENFQISLDMKRLHADNTISNISDVQALAKQVACIFSNILNC